MRPPPSNSLTGPSSGRPCRPRAMSRATRRPRRPGSTRSRPCRDTAAAGPHPPVSQHGRPLSGLPLTDAVHHRMIGTALELGGEQRPGPTRYGTRSARTCLPALARGRTLEESPDPAPARCRRAVAAHLEPPLGMQNHPNGAGVSIHALDDHVPPDATGRPAPRSARRTPSPYTADRATSTAHHEFDPAGTPSTCASASQRAPVATRSKHPRQFDLRILKKGTNKARRRPRSATVASRTASGLSVSGQPGTFFTSGAFPRSVRLAGSPVSGVMPVSLR